MLLLVVNNLNHGYVDIHRIKLGVSPPGDVGVTIIDLGNLDGPITIHLTKLLILYRDLHITVSPTTTATKAKADKTNREGQVLG
jgi:hypothetical protein